MEIAGSMSSGVRRPAAAASSLGETNATRADRMTALPPIRMARRAHRRPDRRAGRLP